MNIFRQNWGHLGHGRSQLLLSLQYWRLALCRIKTRRVGQSPTTFPQIFGCTMRSERREIGGTSLLVAAVLPAMPDWMVSKADPANMSHAAIAVAIAIAVAVGEANTPTVRGDGMEQTIAACTRTFAGSSAFGTFSPLKTVDNLALGTFTSSLAKAFITLTVPVARPKTRPKSLWKTKATLAKALAIAAHQFADH